MSTWPAARRELAWLSVLVAVATGAVAVLLGGGATFLPLFYVLVAGVAVFFPMGIAFQVIAGQLLAAGLLLGAEELSWLSGLLLVPVIVGVVGTAELLAVVGRMETPMPVDVAGVGRRVAWAAAVGGGAFGVVALLGGVPGPAGFFSVVLAAGACGVSAVRLAKPERGGFQVG